MALWEGAALGALGGWAAMTWAPLPHGALFRPWLVATEWAHWGALFAAAQGASLASRGAVGLACVAGAIALLLAGPLLWARLRTTALLASLTALCGPPAAPVRLHRVLGRWPRARPRETHRYDAERGLELELRRPPGDHAAAPVLLLVHGGSWAAGDRHQLGWISDALAARGLVVAAIDYRLAPGAVFPAQLDDVERAIAWLAAQAPALGLDAGKLVLGGRSAGGQLALLAGYRPQPLALRGVIGLYAPTDLVWSWGLPGPRYLIDTHPILTAYLGAPYDPDAPEIHARYEQASPVLIARPPIPPTLLIHGQRDRLVTPLQTERLAARLRELSTPHAVLRLPWGRHGCDVNPTGPGGQLVLAAVAHACHAFCQEPR